MPTSSILATGVPAPASYGELRKLARSRLYDGGRNTLMDTTVLVHESYLRFIRGGQLRSDDRRAFFAYASQVMRSVIIDAVRERRAERRGGDLQRATHRQARLGKGQAAVGRDAGALRNGPVRSGSPRAAARSR